MSSQQPNPATAYIRFADWCLNFDSLSEEAKHIVDVLLKIAGTSDCYEAERILSNSTSFFDALDRDNNQISDLTPDCYEAEKILSNLTSLGLGNSQISDVTPLQSLTNLTFIYLNDNQISDVTPLQSLTNLTYLYLYNNQISNVTPLQSLWKNTDKFTRKNGTRNGC